MRAKDANGNLKSVKVTVEGMGRIADAARAALTPNPSPDSAGEGSEEPEKVGQMLLAMCATCAHTKASHEAGPCAETWKVDDGKREIRCRCVEYWAIRRDVEDGMPVSARGVGFAGFVDIELDRRVTSEFWDGLRQGRGLTLLVRGSVTGKDFREKDYRLKETRKLRVEQVFFIQEDTFEMKRVLDVFGNEVDPETGEVLGEDA